MGSEETTTTDRPPITKRRTTYPIRLLLVTSLAIDNFVAFARLFGAKVHTKCANFLTDKLIICKIETYI
jgi:hypothetical protein